MNTNTIEYKGHTITCGTRLLSCWAQCGSIYEGGYRSERSAVSAVKRQLDKKQQPK